MTEKTRSLLVLMTVVGASYAMALACSSDAGPDDDDGGPLDMSSPDTTSPDMSSPDTTSPDTSTPDTSTPDTGNSDTSQPTDTANNDTSTPDMGPPEYRYVLIVDTDGSTNDPTEHVGADIDAVLLYDGMSDTYAAAPDSTAGDAAYPEGLAGAPTSPVCLQGAFVSIGTQGPLIFSFEGLPTIDSGDVITVFEVDETTCAPSGPDEDEFEIRIGVSADANGGWLSLGNCTEGQACMVTVP